MWTTPARPTWPCVAFTIGLVGCAGEQSRRYAALAVDVGPLGSGTSSASEALPEIDALMRLDREVLIRAIIAHNPSIESAKAALRAALAEYPQVTALPDPMLEYELAPLSIGSSDVRFGQVAQLGQRFPWPGKLSLAGEVALAEAEGAKEALSRTRLELAVLGSSLYDAYYAVARSLELNEEHRGLVEEIKAAAAAQYAAARAPQQDVLQAEVELAHVLHRDVVLGARRAVIVARLNGLLHRRPDAPLPPPPALLSPALEPPPPSGALQAEAMERRPELRAIRARIGGRRSAVALAKRRYFPDFGVMASYNSMWGQEAHRWMTGVSFDLPFVQIGARSAGVEQAEARLSESEAALVRMEDDVRVEVESARERLVEAQHVVHLYRTRLLPAVGAQIEAARVGYETGQNSFQALIDAERSLRTLELEYQDALAQVGVRQAELSRAIGEIPGLEERNDR